MNIFISTQYLIVIVLIQGQLLIVKVLIKCYLLSTFMFLFPVLDKMTIVNVVKKSGMRTQMGSRRKELDEPINRDLPPQ